MLSAFMLQSERVLDFHLDVAYVARALYVWLVLRYSIICGEVAGWPAFPSGIYLVAFAFRLLEARRGKRAVLTPAVRYTLRLTTTKSLSLQPSLPLSRPVS